MSKILGPNGHVVQAERNTYLVVEIIDRAGGDEKSNKSRIVFNLDQPHRSSVNGGLEQLKRLIMNKLEKMQFFQDAPIEQSPTENFDA